MKHDVVKTNISDAISSGCQMLLELADEMSNWYDSMPENLQSSSKADAVQEAQQTLEGCEEPDIPKAFENILLDVHILHKKRKSRSDRRNDAVTYLQTAGDRLREIESDDEAFPDQDLRDDACLLADEVENIISEAENVEFPGMFG